MSRSIEQQSEKRYPVVAWLVTLLVPVALVLTAVRLMMFPWFLTFEYSMPGFPDDQYGFTKQDRLYWSAVSLEYLLNDAKTTFVANLRFQDGTPVYNERELLHMDDAKRAIQGALKAWKIAWLLLAALGLRAWFGKWWQTYLRSLGRGGWLTVFFVFGVIVFVVIGFSVFFVAFHQIFFNPGTWMFAWSDTFIRLFPERFWRDIFIYVGIISAAFGIILALVTLGRPGRVSKPAAR